MLKTTNKDTTETHKHIPTDEQEPVKHNTKPKEEGSTTVEYAIGVVVAATLAGLLLTIVRSDAVRQGLESIIEQALNVV